MPPVEEQAVESAAKTNSDKQVQRKVADRWTPALAEGGWVPVSNFFLDHYRELPIPLSTHEVVMVLHILRHKWTEKVPWPSAKRLAKRMGISSTAARTHIRTLEKKGYLRKLPRAGWSNGLDLTPLFEALEALKVVIDRAKGGRELRERDREGVTAMA
jgi:hypothetical protein